MRFNAPVEAVLSAMIEKKERRNGETKSTDDKSVIQTLE